MVGESTLADHLEDFNLTAQRSSIGLGSMRSCSVLGWRDLIATWARWTREGVSWMYCIDICVEGSAESDLSFYPGLYVPNASRYEQSCICSSTHHAGILQLNAYHMTAPVGLDERLHHHIKLVGEQLSWGPTRPRSGPWPQRSKTREISRINIGTLSSQPPTQGIMPDWPIRKTSRLNQQNKILRQISAMKGSLSVFPLRTSDYSSRSVPLRNQDSCYIYACIVQIPFFFNLQDFDRDKCGAHLPPQDRAQDEARASPPFLSSGSSERTPTDRLATSTRSKRMWSSGNSRRTKS